MNNDQFVRYKALDRCLRAYLGKYDMDALIKECTNAVCSFHCDYDKKVSRSTVEHDLTDLKLRYDIKLRGNYYEGRKKLYQYEDTSFSLMQKLLADGELEQMMLQNILDTLSLYDDIPQYKWLYLFIQQRIQGIKAEATQAIEFQNNPDLLGMENFDKLLDAILRRQPLALQYQPYRHDARECVIHPYLLKQFNDRWFLIARTDGYDTLSNFAIDRIKAVDIADIPYQPVGLDLEEYFAPVVGVSRDIRKDVEFVLIRIASRRYPYIESKPIHWSQTEIKEMRDETSYVVKLHVQINNELEAKILSLGNEAEVLSPPEFRERIMQKIDDLYQKYHSSADTLRN